MGFHNAIAAGGVHVVANWVYANNADMLAASGFVTGDVGKVAWETDNDTLWILTATTPTWVAIGGLTNPMTAVGDVIIGGASGTPERLPIGTIGKVLTSNGTTAGWASGSTAAGLYAGNVVAPPALGSWTWLNQGGATATNNGGTLLMLIPDSSTSLDWRLLYVAEPTPPYGVVACISSMQGNFNSQTAGIYFCDTGSGNISGLEFLTQVGVRSWSVRNFASPTSGGSIVYQQTGGEVWRGPDTAPMWVRLRNDATTLSYDVSLDGSNWRNLYSQLLTAFVTPNSLAFGGLCVTSGALAFEDVNLISWTTTNSAAF